MAKLKVAFKVGRHKHSMLRLPDSPFDPLERLVKVDIEDSHSTDGTISGCRYTESRNDPIKLFAAEYITWTDTPSARRRLLEMQQEVVGGVRHLLQWPSSTGFFTSGGTESIVQAVLAARNSRPEVTRPNVVFSPTAHVALSKACAYLGLEEREVPVDGQLRLSPASLQAIDGNTVLVYASFPSYAYGSCEDVHSLA